MPDRARPKQPRVLVHLALACLIVSLGLLTAWTPAPVGAASIVVNTAIDSYDANGTFGDGCSLITIADLPGGGDGKTSLREAICAANNTPGDDVITFDLPDPSTIQHNGSMGRYVVTTNLQITGPGKNALALDGGDEAGIFSIDSGTVGISNLTIRNAADGQGAGIYNQSTLTVTDAIIDNNVVPRGSYASGGGILNYGTLTLLRTTVSNNQAGFGGGIANLGTLTMTDSDLTGNIAGDPAGPFHIGDGAGLYNVGIATVNGGTVTGNNAAVTAGGLYNGYDRNDLTAPPRPADVVAPNLDVQGTTISGNTAASGGGVYVASGLATINTSTISGNTACFGGGIADNSSVILTNSTVSGNTVTLTGECPVVGGGIYANGTLNATNSTISGNSAPAQGAGLYATAFAAVELSYVTVTGNSTGNEGSGAGIFLETVGSVRPAAARGELTLNSTIVAGNDAHNPSGNDCDGAITSLGHNLVGSGTGCPTGGTGDLTTTAIATVLNTTLTNNGGPTKTHALVAGSATLNAGDGKACPAADQRGTQRPQNGGCDIGAYELGANVTLTVQTTGTGTVAASPAPISSGGTPTNTTYSYAPGTVVTLTATPGNGQVFARWIIDGAGPLPYGKGWASPLTITLDTDHTAQAQFETRPSFTDVPTANAAYLPITELAARGIAKGYTAAGCTAQQPPVAAPCYAPGNRTVRAETALFLTRLLDLESENHGNGGFTDLQGQSAAAQQAIGTLAFHGIMQGYGNGKFGPNDFITHTELTLVISRAMVFKGYWTRATVDDPAIYPNLNLGAQPRLDLVTFVQNAGNLPGFANNTPRAAVDQPARRDWTAQALWLALGGYFGVDQPGKGGFVP